VTFLSPRHHHFGVFIWSGRSINGRPRSWFNLSNELKLSSENKAKQDGNGHRHYWDHCCLDVLGSATTNGLEADIISDLHGSAAPIPWVIRQMGQPHDANGMVTRILLKSTMAAPRQIPLNVIEVELSQRDCLPSVALSRLLAPNA
jgi:hypothetical protein